jgi:hypothetical protein
MRPRPPCSTPAAGEPGPAISGCSPAPTGRGGAERRRGWWIATRRDAVPSMRRRCSGASPACCKPTPAPVLGPRAARGARTRGPPIAASPTPSAPAARSLSPVAGRTACWSHCRREFFDLAKSAPAPIASEALRRIAEFYRIEADIRGSSADQRQAVRRQKTRPLVEALKPWKALKPWFEKTLAQLPGGSQIAKAIRDALNQWDGLTRFLDDARIEIAPMPPGTHYAVSPLPEKTPYSPAATKALKTGRCSASLIETCRLNSINPEAYVTDVPTGLVNNWPSRRLAQLLPWT